MITHAAQCTSSQFRCDSGQCVSSSFRCNGYTGGCSDGSDERGCCKLTEGNLHLKHLSKHVDNLQGIAESLQHHFKS